MLQKFIALTLAAVAMASAYGAEPEVKQRTYEVKEADNDLKSLLTRWANVEGKKLVWEANGNAEIKDANALNFSAALYKASSFEQALIRLNQKLLSSNEENPAKLPPLRACIFSDAIVIRTIEQPSCGSPL